MFMHSGHITYTAVCISVNIFFLLVLPSPSVVHYIYKYLYMIITFMKNQNKYDLENNYNRELFYNLKQSVVVISLL